MKNILKSIVLFLLSLTQVYSQQDTIPKSDSTRIVQDQKGNGSRSTNGNYINMDLPGIDLIGADFKPLDDTIAKLNLAGWDVKVIGFYGLSGSMDRTVYDQLLSEIKVDKQVIVKLNFINGIRKAETEVTNKDLSIIEVEKLSNIISQYLNQYIINLNTESIIHKISQALGLVIQPKILEGDLNLGGSGREPGNPIKIVVNEPGYYVTSFGMPVWLDKGTIAEFWQGSSCHASDCARTSFNSRGTIYSVILPDNLGIYYSNSIIDEKTGLRLRGLINKNGEYWNGYKHKIPSSSETIVVNFVYKHSNNCDANIIAASVNVPSYEEGKYLRGEYKGIETFSINGYYIGKQETSGSIVFELSNASANIIELPCQIDVDKKLIDFLKENGSFTMHWVYEPVKHARAIIITNDPKTSILYDFYLNEFYGVDNKSGMTVPLNFINGIDKANLKNILDKMQVFSTNMQVAKISIILVSTGLSLGTSSILAGAAIGVAETGAIYAIDKDKDAAVVTLICVGIGSTLGPAISKIRGFLRNKNAIDPLMEQTSKAYLKGKGIRDLAFNISGEMHFLSDIIENARKVYNLTDDKIDLLIDDIVDLASQNKHADFVAGLISKNSNFIKAWEFVIEGAAIRIKPEILEKISIALNRGVKEIPDVVSHANHPNIVTYTVEHIFRGHGANGGRHHISALIADNTRKLTDRLKETADGFYEAVFKNADGTTSTKSFWPDTWDENRIMDELKHAMGNNPTNIPGTNNWVGYTTTNQKIIYYVKSSDNSIISAFPEL